MINNKTDIDIEPLKLAKLINRDSRNKTTLPSVNTKSATNGTLSVCVSVKGQSLVIFTPQHYNRKKISIKVAIEPVSCHYRFLTQ